MIIFYENTWETMRIQNPKPQWESEAQNTHYIKYIDKNISEKTHKHMEKILGFPLSMRCGRFQ